MIKIFLSIPVSIDIKEINKIVLDIQKNFTQDTHIYWWDRDSSYDSSMISDCDLFAVIPTRNEFNFFVKKSLSIGCLKETMEAYGRNKPLALIYKASTGIYNLYDVATEKDDFTGKLTTIRGISGSTKWLETIFTQRTNNGSYAASMKQIDKIDSSQYVFVVDDPRLLLLL